VLHVTEAAMFPAQLLKSSATLTAEGLPVRIEVKISRVRYIVITPHTELWIHTSTDFTVGKSADILIQEAKSN